jgi:hypothetical protein
MYFRFISSALREDISGGRIVSKMFTYIFDGSDHIFTYFIYGGIEVLISNGKQSCHQTDIVTILIRI